MAQRINERGGLGDLAVFHPRPQTIEQRSGDLDTKVGAQHGFFEIVPSGLIDGGATQHTRGGGGEHAAGAR